ncbi:3-dehydroquinate synthase [Thalassotalea aquiviva]|uniref:3-dehydroquinate synthase n=1 Tax=Thalassotalea aquiviva TaxID=3242415 RepID=UPI00352AAFC5
MHSLVVSLAERSYPIYIEAGLFSQTSQLCQHIKSKRVCIVTNTVVAPLYLESIKSVLTDFHLDVFILEDGESEKNLANFERIIAHMLANKHGRDSTLIALGGGVIGDITGFVAACYQRGIDFIQIPTTLLSQVDSSVGGKTAVNHPLGKNMIGAFYQPKAVFIDTNSLSTLPSREFNAGISEVIKYGILGDEEFFCWLEQHKALIKAKDSDTLNQMIQHCCQQKADIVAADERESGERALLNLGHTFGHAIEAEMGYGVWLHGEAVATGMVQATKLAKVLGYLSAQELNRVIDLLQFFDLPTLPPESMTVDDFIKHMSRDKKNINGKIRLIVPTKIGTSQIFDNITIEQLQQVI